MKAWKVSKGVGNVKNDTPDLLLPDNVVVMDAPWTEEELIRLWELEGKDVSGEFDPRLHVRSVHLSRKS